MLKEKPSVFVENSEEGKDKVIQFKGKFAFFAETAVIDYFKHRDCNLTQIGGRLDTKEYGIAMPLSELKPQLLIILTVDQRIFLLLLICIK